jgi:hypothetical protein
MAVLTARPEGAPAQALRGSTIGVLPGSRHGGSDLEAVICDRHQVDRAPAVQEVAAPKTQL